LYSGKVCHKNYRPHYTKTHDNIKVIRQVYRSEKALSVNLQQKHKKHI